MKRQLMVGVILIALILQSGCSITVTPTAAVLPVPTIESTSTTFPSPTESFTPTAPPSQTTIASESGSPGIGDSLYPDFGNGGYDAQHYTLDFTVNDVETGNLNGTVTMGARATQTLGSFNLDFIGFEIVSITVNGQEAEFTRNGQELTIMPSELLMNGDTFTVETVYSGAPEQIQSAALPVLTGWVLSEGESYVVSEPDGAANYFPVNDHPLDKASYTFRVTVPKPFEVAANGTLTETTDNGDSTTYVWDAPDPMASYLATIDIADFDSETMEGPNGITIRNYYVVGLPEGVNKAFARQSEMIEFFSEVFGPYPFDVYGSLVLNTRNGVALENQTLSVYGSDMINVDDITSSETVVAHELSHQWFGDSVSVADWGDIWLNESFATYAEGLWIEHTKGREALDTWVINTYSIVDRFHTRWSPPGMPPANDLFNGGVYLWGGLALHALRMEVGDEVFFDILKTYYARYEGGNASTADFIAVAEEISGLDLEAFFNDWLYSTDVPPINALNLGT